MSEDNFVVVGESKYVVVKTGRAHAEQVLQFTKWFSKHGVPAIQTLQANNQVIEADNIVEFLTKIGDALTVDALIDLFIAVTGCTREEGELYFDIVTLIDTVTIIYEKQPSIRRLIERFFSTPALPEPKPGE